MAAVELRNVRKSFGASEVLHGISLDIADQEFVVLVGASGCGKSTLLRLIAGLDTVAEGEILIGGRPVAELPPKHRDVAMVFQNYALYPNKTVFENMAFGLRMRHVDHSVIAQRVQEAAKILKIVELLSRYPRQLSGGQRQRVAMGRAIVRDPAVFLFDEPLSNLDATLRVQMRAEIKELHQRVRTTMIYVTHDQVEAITLADRIVVMRDGAVDQIGPPLDVYDRPANTYVAGFIGSPAMNLVEGVVRRNGKLSWLETDRGYRFPLPSSAPARDGKRATYGIRPEHLILTDKDDGLAAQVEVVEPLGAETLLLTKAGECQLRVLLRERANLSRGQKIHVSFDLSNVHLFSCDSGEHL